MSGSVPASKDVLLKSYQKRLKDDVGSLTSNLTEITKLLKPEISEHQVTRATQCEEDIFETQVRAANMVRACQSLIKLISEIKQYLILNDFPSVNEAIAQNSNLFLGSQESVDNKLTYLRDSLAIHLFELEEDYYSSNYK